MYTTSFKLFVDLFICSKTGIFSSLASFFFSLHYYSFLEGSLVRQQKGTLSAQKYMKDYKRWWILARKGMLEMVSLWDSEGIKIIRSHRTQRSWFTLPSPKGWDKTLEGNRGMEEIMKTQVKRSKGRPERKEPHRVHQRQALQGLRSTWWKKVRGPLCVCDHLISGKHSFWW